jgi:6-pyruvoyltetrahydropterin/6-carboxytetrahydropterin synthase
MAESGYSVTRYHDISCGHRVCGHENKCRFLHGHNYRVHFTCAPINGLDHLGRVIDFGVIKSKLCEWLEDNWDHKFLLWTEDPFIEVFSHARSNELSTAGVEVLEQAYGSIVQVPFNPTAENMAQFLVQQIGPLLLVDTGVKLVHVQIDETRKCSASYGEEE